MMRTVRCRVYSVLVVALALAACAGRNPLSAPGALSTPAAVATTAAVAAVVAAASPGASPAALGASKDWIRPAQFAGTWYPADAKELASTVDRLLGAAQPVEGTPLALVVPHAGYAYSGPVAAAAFRQLEGGNYDVAVIIGADHQPPLAHPISVWTKGAFETPLGQVPVDTELAQVLIASDPRITSDPPAHEGEHVIEAELPFLQRSCPTCDIVPVLMGTDDDQAVATLANALKKALPGRRAVVIASSDLSHYPAYADAKTVDAATLSAIETGDPQVLESSLSKSMAKNVPHLATAACSDGPIKVAMSVARQLGAETVTTLDYANSGDAEGADREQVVGYGAVMFWHAQADTFSEQQRAVLLAQARDAIKAQLQKSEAPAKPDDPALNKPAALFVTLRKGTELRGCIGRLTADVPLYQAVQEMARAAAFEDPRFPALTPDELNQVKIEISVLSPLRRVVDLDEIQIGKHGLAIYSNMGQGVFLPQVPVEQGWDRDAYLENLCAKAGMAPGCWKEGSTLYSFTATVFGE